jgi:hypothetical protein
VAKTCPCPSVRASRRGEEANGKEEAEGGWGGGGRTVMVGVAPSTHFVWLFSLFFSSDTGFPLFFSQLVVFPQAVSLSRAMIVSASKVCMISCSFLFPVFSIGPCGGRHHSTTGSVQQR